MVRQQVIHQMEEEKEHHLVQEQIQYMEETQTGALAVLNSLTKIPYKFAVDGISYTFAITPATLGNTDEAKRTNLVSMLDRIFRTKRTSYKCKCI